MLFAPSTGHEEPDLVGAVSRKKQKDKKKKQREQSLLEKEIFNLMESMADIAITQAMDDIFEGWK